MLADVGEAIADYLVHGRASSDSRALFLRTVGPHIGFSTCAAVGDIVRKALLAADVKTASYGAHQFRHGFATEMLKRGSTIADIGYLLGHKTLGATYTYAKVDITRLRELAVDWPAVCNGNA